MNKKILLLILLFPILNFLHESGHWLGAKSVDANPKMMFQRVDVDSSVSQSLLDESIYNWAGPTVNFTIMGGSLFYPALIPIAFLMAVHRLGPNFFAVGLYTVGKLQFTNDETKQFPPKYRLIASIVFSVVYLFLSIYFLLKWFPVMKLQLRILLISYFTVMWLCYGLFLDFLDKRPI